ncbi:unnamed protein product, partial [Closterium sp. Naga37s-1]
KCAAWSAAHIDPASLTPHVPFSADGIRVLGSPIGPQAGCAALVQERLSAAAEPLPLLSQMDPQLCLLLLTRCVSRRASYLVRTTPLEVLPADTWSEWGEQLLHTYLTAAHTTIPREEEERGRIWRQAALPVTLGGLGITNPATEGVFAYLAAIISTAHLLRSFGDTLHPSIAQMLPLLDADANSPSANALRDKTHEAIAADELGLQGPFGSLGEEQLYQLLEDPTGQEKGSVAAANASVEVVGEVAAAAEVPAEAVTAVGRAGGTAAAFGGGSTSPSASHQGAQQQTLELGLVVDREPSEAVALFASPAPVPAAVLAAAVTAATAAGNLADAPVEGEVSVAVVSAGTSAAAEGADTQERDQAASGRRGHGTGAPGRAARGKGGRKLRAQPAPRRPGAGLGPGAPGPLRGWSWDWRDRHNHRGSRREERHRLGEGGGMTRAGPGKERRSVGPEAGDAGQEVEEGAQSSAEGRRL